MGGVARSGQPEDRKTKSFLGVRSVVLCAALSLLGTSWAGVARATYSIAGVDLLARQMGAAGTSCLGGQDVAVIYKSAPGIGVVLGQAQYNASGHQRALELLAGGMAPDAVLAAVTAPEFDALASVRQYAIVTASGSREAFTGSDTGQWSGDTSIGGDGRLLSIQGNLLTSAHVVNDAALSFANRACDLAEQLVMALEAGAQHGEGDRRCTPAIPSDSAFVFVDSIETGERLVDLRVPSSGTENPLIALRAQLTEHHRSHPCVPQALPGRGLVRADSSGCRFGRGSAGSGAAGWAVLALALTARRRRSATLRRSWRSTTS